jgi:hypothetical protein
VDTDADPDPGSPTNADPYWSDYKVLNNGIFTGSGAFLTPGAGIWDGKKYGSGSRMNSPVHISYFRDIKNNT